MEAGGFSLPNGLRINTELERGIYFTNFKLSQIFAQTYFLLFCGFTQQCLGSCMVCMVPDSFCLQNPDLSAYRIRICIQFLDLNSCNLKYIPYFLLHEHIFYYLDPDIAITIHQRFIPPQSKFFSVFRDHLSSSPIKINFSL